MEKKQEKNIYPSHNCFEKNEEVWGNNVDYNYIKCDVCGRITHFKWKSTWFHIRFIFWGRIKSFRKNNKKYGRSSWWGERS